MFPLSFETSARFSDASGSVSRMGLATSRTGLIAAMDSAAPVMAPKEADTAPYAELKAMYSEGVTLFFTARKNSAIVPIRLMAMETADPIRVSKGGL